MDEISAGRQPGATGVDFGANETWNRLNADPLLLIKRNEVNKVKAAVSNPYLVSQIKEQLRAARDAKREKKAARKKEKKGKKDKTSRKRSRRDESRCAMGRGGGRERVVQTDCVCVAARRCWTCAAGKWPSLPRPCPTPMHDRCADL